MPRSTARRALSGTVRGAVAAAVSLVLLAGCSSSGTEDAGSPPPTASSTGAGATPTASDAGAAFDAMLAAHDGPSEPDAESVYRLALAEHAADLTTCRREAPGGAGTCEKPASLGRELKQAVNIAIVVDASGSMAEQVDGRPKIDLARDAVEDFAATLPAQANVSLRVFGNAAEEPKEVSCASQTQLLPFTPGSAARVGPALDDVTVQGYTPLAGALAAVRQDFANRPAASNSNFVYVVSDGEETCDGDPVAQAEQLTAAAIDVQVNLIGFSVDARSAEQLRRTAAAGGGVYADARDGEALGSAFAQVGDWDAWTAYYECLYQETQSQFFSSWLNSTEYTICLNTAVTEEKLDLDQAGREWGEGYQEAYEAQLDAVTEQVEAEPDPQRRDELQSLLAERREHYADTYSTVTGTFTDLASARYEKLRGGIEQKRAEDLTAAEQERESALAEVQELRQRTGTTSGSS